jgi:hypothetical protein
LSCKARPIVGACGCPTEKISAFVDLHIKQIAQSVPSYLRDTTDFLRKLRCLQDIPTDALLVTADVTSLYPSIPKAQGLTALRDALEMRERPEVPTEALVCLADLVLSYNHFTFNGCYYTQVDGTAMGTKFAPNYAIIFMSQYEDGLLRKAELKPMCWFRFIDDIFFIWTHGTTALLEFMRIANEHNPAIKLTFEHNSRRVNFLDVVVNLEEGKVVTDLYRKPTDTLQYLHFDSCHPREHKLPIAYSQALRIRKICSRKADAIYHCALLKEALTRRGYPRKQCSRYIERALNVDRDLLILPVFGPANKPPIRMVLPFHPDVAKISDIIRDRSGLLQGLDQPIRVFWKPPRQLRNQLVASHLKPKNMGAPQRKRTKGQGTRKCGKSGCKTCSMIRTDAQAVSSKTGLAYDLPDATCSSKNVIYLLSFVGCTQQYIGQTKQALHLRMNLYRSGWGKKKTDQPAVYHLLNHNHKWEHLRVQVLQIVEDSKSLAQAEFHWISQMMTDLPHGLNVQNILYRNCYTMEDALQREKLQLH